MPLHPQAQDLLDTLTSAPTPLNQLPPAEAREAYRRFIEPRNFDPEPVGRVEDREIARPHGPVYELATSLGVLQVPFFFEDP